MKISEEEIKSYMCQFNVAREQAIKEITGILEEYYENQEISMQETLESIKQDMYWRGN
jgi:L-amino acid N-acyltransferase YncA